MSGYTWEAPLLLKRRLAHIGSASVVFGGGAALRRASNIEYVSVSRVAFAQSRINYDGSFVTRPALGAVLSGGLEIPVRRLRLRPELRYSWFERPLFQFFTIVPRQDSLVIILGVSPITGRR